MPVFTIWSTKCSPGRSYKMLINNILLDKLTLEMSAGSGDLRGGGGLSIGSGSAAAEIDLAWV
jgi:hypothetical protein